MTIFTRELTARQFYPSIEVTRDCLRLGSVDEVPMADKPKKSSPVELDPPAEALDAMSSVEILRAWIADGRLHVTFDAETFAHDVGEWGRMLADISHHVARGVALAGLLTEREALSAIAESFERGVTGSSTVTAGRVQGRTNH